MNDGPRVALTFDAEHSDRPLAAADGGERILDDLARAGTRATFFLQSSWASANPALARRIAGDGHLIGNHSVSHARPTRLSDAGLRSEVVEAGETIASVTGTDPAPWFRCPFGDGHDDPRVLGILRELGYRNVHWDVDTMDWKPGRTAEEVARAVVEGASANGPVAVVLLHSWPRPTTKALPLALARLADAGASFVTVDRLEPPA